MSPRHGPATTCHSQQGRRGKLAASSNQTCHVAPVWVQTVLKGPGLQGRRNTLNDRAVSAGFPLIPKADPRLSSSQVAASRQTALLGRASITKRVLKTATVKKAYDVDRKTQEDHVNAQRKVCRSRGAKEGSPLAKSGKAVRCQGPVGSPENCSSTRKYLNLIHVQGVERN